METTMAATTWPTLWTIIGAVAAFGVTFATAAGMIINERAGVFALVIIGFLMCATGGSGRAIGQYGMTHPISLVGSVIGLLVLLIGASVLFGFRLPLIADDRTAFFAIAAIILIKLTINGGFYFLTR